MYCKLDRNPQNLDIIEKEYVHCFFGLTYDGDIYMAVGGDIELIFTLEEAQAVVDELKREIKIQKLKSE